MAKTLMEKIEEANRRPVPYEGLKLFGDGLASSDQESDSMPRATRPYPVHGFVIINPYGQIWSGHLFDSAEAAMDYLVRWWGNSGFDRRKWRVAPAGATLEVTGEFIKIKEPA